MCQCLHRPEVGIFLVCGPYLKFVDAPYVLWAKPFDKIHLTITFTVDNKIQLLRAQKTIARAE